MATPISFYQLHETLDTNEMLADNSTLVRFRAPYISADGESSPNLETVVSLRIVNRKAILRECRSPSFASQIFRYAAAWQRCTSFLSANAIEIFA